MTRRPQTGGCWCYTCTPGSWASLSAVATWTRRWAIYCTTRAYGPPPAQRSSTGTGAIARLLDEQSNTGRIFFDFIHSCSLVVEPCETCGGLAAPGFLPCAVCVGSVGFRCCLLGYLRERWGAMG